MALLATAALSWLSYRSVRRAMVEEFERRLGGLAVAAASQLSADDVADALRLGEEGGGYIAIQVQLEQLRSTPGTVNASLLDPARAVIYDTRGPDRERAVSALAALVPAALDSAYAGRATVSAPFTLEGDLLRAGVAPVRDGARLVAAVAVEARPSYVAALDDLSRRMWLTTLVIGLAVLVLAVVIFRVTQAAVRLERRLSRAENLVAMGRLTATLAHEIKNPLAIIRGSAERLGRLEPEARRMADFVVEEADRLSRTVTRYLQFARGDAAEEGAGDVSLALRATLDLLEGELAGRRVALDRDALASGELPVALDNESLKQVFLNLILNAVEAMPEGGRLTVRSGERRGRIEASVADTGTGIPPEALRQLAQPFFTTKAKGTGLGLFLTRRLVHSGGGRLAIESRPGQGTVCTVSLPRRRSDAAARRSP